MAKKEYRSVPAGSKFVEDEVSKRIYGVKFTRQGKHQLWDNVAAASGLDRKKVLFLLLDKAMHGVAKKHGSYYSNTYVDDALVYLCDQFDIDHRQFEHNIELWPINGFVDFAIAKLSGSSLPKSELQREAQRSRLWALWQEWIEIECKSHGCECEKHVWCDEVYESPNFDAIATHIADVSAERERLLASVDMKPRGKAVRATEDALARIAVATRAGARS
jgi:hypothetical protein